MSHKGIPNINSLREMLLLLTFKPLFRDSVYLIFVLTFLFSSCIREEIPQDFSIYSDMEILSKNSKFLLANNDSSYKFKGGAQQTALRSRSGNHSVYSSPKNAFTLSINFPHIYRDSYVDVSIWKKGKEAHLVCILEGTKQYFTTDKTVETDDEGWEKLNLKFHVPPVHDYYKLKFYLWNSGQDTVFYDDISLNISKYQKFPEFDLPIFNLELDTSDIISLMDTRKRAFSAGILQTEDDDWVKGFIFSNNKMMKANLRLKGDWLDHLHGYKWSYRIKLKKDNSWNGMKVFSVQNPMARLGVSEWLLHKFMISEGLLTTRYGFMPVSQNGQNMGLYAWEEHFVKQLVESQNRREGPMLRFVEDALWDSRVLDDEGKMNNKKTPVFDVAVIKPFSTGKTVKDTNLFNQFLIAQNLMVQYRNRLRTASDIFNVELLASMYAIADVFMARHGLIWHNQRFYYNPVLCKLEPIAYDCYSDIGLENNPKDIIYGFLHNDISQLDEYIMVRELFNDTTFVDNYIEYLVRYSDVKFLDSVFDSYRDEVVFYDSLVMREYDESTYYESEILDNAKKIRKELPAYIQQVADMKKENKVWKNTSFIQHNYDTVLPAFFAPNLLVAYVEKVIGDSTLLKVKSFFTEDITILGIGKVSKKIREIIVPVPVLAASREGLPVISTFMVSNNQVNYLLFSVSSSNKLFSVEINHWPEPTGALSPLQQLTNLYPFPDTSIIEKVDGKNVYIKKGKIVLVNPVLIPEGYIVHFKVGTTIDMVDSAAFISHSPVLMHGTSESPIVITSSDFTARGFTVLNANSSSVVDFVKFENLNTLDYKGWILTGAVNFYESDVTITNTKFYRNQCEDALNIIRSEFILSNSSFDFIYGDAFDGDFCKGEVLNTSFTNIGNDALDFSGSDIIIKNTSIVGAKDKGISGGENSRVYISNTTIQNSNIGFASKDLSVVEVVDSKVESCNYGIVLLQKKSEFGPSSMILKNTIILNSKTDMLIEKNSRVDVDGKIIEGKEVNLSEIFY